MRFMMVHKLDDRDPVAWAPDERVMAEMGALLGEMAEAGVMVAGEGLRPSKDGPGAILRFTDGKETETIDGPFPEAKEVIGGFVIVDVASREEALTWARRFAGIVCDANTLEMEIRKVAEPEDFDESIQEGIREHDEIVRSAPTDQPG